MLHDRSFEDDPTRAYRAVRFATRLGFSLHRTTRRRLTEAVAAGTVSRLSGARLGRELRLALGEGRTARIVGSLDRLGLLRAVDPRLRVSASLSPRLRRSDAAWAWYRETVRGDDVPAWLPALGTLRDGLCLDRKAGVTDIVGQREAADEPCLDYARQLGDLMPQHFEELNPILVGRVFGWGK